MGEVYANCMSKKRRGGIGTSGPLPCSCDWQVWCLELGTLWFKIFLRSLQNNCWCWIKLYRGKKARVNFCQSGSLSATDHSTNHIIKKNNNSYFILLDSPLLLQSWFLFYSIQAHELKYLSILVFMTVLKTKRSLTKRSNLFLLDFEQFFWQRQSCTCYFTNQSKNPKLSL